MCVCVCVCIITSCAIVHGLQSRELAALCNDVVQARAQIQMCLHVATCHCGYLTNHELSALCALLWSKVGKLRSHFAHVLVNQVCK